jgi:hypothetical protein
VDGLLPPQRLSAADVRRFAADLAPTAGASRACPNIVATPRCATLVAGRPRAGLLLSSLRSKRWCAGGWGGRPRERLAFLLLATAFWQAAAAQSLRRACPRHDVRTRRGGMPPIHTAVRDPVFASTITRLTDPAQLTARSPHPPATTRSQPVQRRRDRRSIFFASDGRRHLTTPKTLEPAGASSR